jgi:unsaturated rhamnogalacturonyl hydrolase
MAKADAYWLAHGVSLTGATWQNAAFHVGNLAYLATPGATSNTATSTWAKNNRYAVNSSTGSARPDDLAAGEVYLKLAQPASIRARVASEVKAGNFTLWSYVDALNMAMPSYARLGILDNSAADLNAMQAQFHYTESTLGLFNEATGLWWRDARFKGTSTYWARGNGWAMMALAKVLQILPSTDPRYAEYLRVFKKMAAALAPLQLADGFWGADLRNPSAYGYEESGTAFFTYAIAWGVNAGILDPGVYKPILTKAWTALSTIALQSSGEVGYVQGATTGAAQPSDGQPVKVTDTSAYGVGGFLLAGSEMVHILASANTPPPANTAPPVVTGAAQEGQTLHTDNGTWTGSPTAYSYAWQDCSSAGANCTTISGATSSSYTLRSSDVGHTIRSQVQATNTAGSAAASSQQTAVVSTGGGSGGGTFGKLAVGGSSANLLGDRKRCEPYPAPSSGHVAKLSAYLAGGTVSGTQDLEGVIYAYSGGVPTSLLATTRELAFASSNRAGWYDLTFATPPAVTSGTTYCIGFISGGPNPGAAAYYYDRTPANVRFTNPNAYASGPSNPFGTASPDNYDESVFATLASS